MPATCWSSSGLKEAKRRRRGVARVERQRCQRDENSEQTAVQHGQEQRGDAGAMAERRAPPCGGHAPPEQDRRAEHREVLEVVHQRIGERRLVEGGRVPEPDDQAMQRGRDRHREQPAAQPPQPGDATARPSGRRSLPGSAVSATTPRLPSTISGAATTISSMCCAMCTAKEVSAATSRGETSATNSAARPDGEAERAPDRHAASGAGPRPQAHDADAIQQTEREDRHQHDGVAVPGPGRMRVIGRGGRVGVAGRRAEQRGQGAEQAGTPPLTGRSRRTRSAASPRRSRSGRCRTAAGRHRP